VGGSLRAAATGALLLVGAALGPVTARAEPREAGAPAPVRGPEALRPRPNYDGRPEPGPRPEDVLVWIPRVIFAPLYFVLELVVRRPLEALASLVERERWYRVFLWEDQKAGLVPTAFVDFGLQPAVGLYFFWNDLGAPGHRISGHVATGGPDWVLSTLRDRVRLADPGRVELSVAAAGLLRPDRVYQGLGPLSRQDDRARFRRGLVEGAVELSIRPWRRSRVRLAAEISYNTFSADGYAIGSDDPSLEDAVEAGVLSLPPGFDGYLAYRQRLVAAIDSREAPPAPGHGVRASALVEQAFDLSRPLDRRWIRYGAALAGFVDVGGERVFSLHVGAELVDPLGPSRVPFTEQVRLGGEPLRLPGFLREQLIGRSGVVATLRYRYPVWTYLDASMFVATGNVFDAHFRDFALDRLRLSFGLSVQSLDGDEGPSFHLTLAFGTSPFARGLDVQAVRFLFGGRTGVF
jgi:hypothetical protein